MGGQLHLKQSHPGRGSTFVFTISGGPFDGELDYDVSDARAASATQPFETQAVPNLSGKKVLVVEDSEDNQLLISRYLSAVGMQVEIAGNGIEGLRKVDKNIYDLVLLDIQMPDMDGHEVARNLRQKGFSKPIIALTAHALKHDRDKAFASGFSEYLTKPINRQILLKTLSKRLSAHDLH
jgi:CheY-like chemotaxis protein